MYNMVVNATMDSLKRNNTKDNISVVIVQIWILVEYCTEIKTILLNKETQVLAWMLFSSSSIFSGFWFIAQIYLSIRNIKSVKYKNIRKIEVIKIGTLPKEFETVYRVEGANDTLEFYPIICRDAHTNYETKLYVSKEDYKRPIGAIITRYLDPYID